MAFKKGQSGNPTGRPKSALSVRELLERKAKIDGHESDQHYIDEFADYLIDNYKESDKLMVWMGDHLFGKAPQPLTGPDGGAIQIQEVTIRIRK